MVICPLEAQVASCTSTVTDSCANRMQGKRKNNMGDKSLIKYSLVIVQIVSIDNYLKLINCDLNSIVREKKGKIKKGKSRPL